MEAREQESTRSNDTPHKLAIKHNLLWPLSGSKALYKAHHTKRLAKDKSEAGNGGESGVEGDAGGSGYLVEY